MSAKAKTFDEQKKQERMLLESLPNELFYDVFEYFSSVDLFRAFNGLNNRFDRLIIEYFQIHQSIDFRLTSREDLNQIRQRYLPLFVNEIHSICLSDEDTNPHEIDIFLSRLFPLHRFVNLQSITFFGIYSIDKVIRILNDLQRISNLKRLKFQQCFFEYDLKKFVMIINGIWSLSNLTHCVLDLIDAQDYSLIPPTIISCSLQDLSIRGIQCGLETLELIYEHTPQLQTLEIETTQRDDDCHSMPIHLSLNKLKLKCHRSPKALLAILRKVPSLTNLTVETMQIDMSGQQWQNLLGQYLPVLKTFNLKMKYQLIDVDNIEEKIDEILKSYRTSFWIDQHQWFVRCFCTTETQTDFINIHTLPYRFNESTLCITDNEHCVFKSTYSDDDDDEHSLIYDHVQNLNYCCNTSEELQLTQIQFPNLHHLTLSLPYNDDFRSFIPRFDKLISLTVHMFTLGYSDHELEQLQLILDQAPRLYYLKLSAWSLTLPKTSFKRKKVIISLPMNIFSSSVYCRIRIRPV